MPAGAAGPGHCIVLPFHLGLAAAACFERGAPAGRAAPAEDAPDRVGHAGDAADTWGSDDVSTVPGSGGGDRDTCSLRSPLSHGSLPSPEPSPASWSDPLALTQRVPASCWRVCMAGGAGAGDEPAGETDPEGDAGVGSPCDSDGVRSLLPFVPLGTVNEDETGDWDVDVDEVARW